MEIMFFPLCSEPGATEVPKLGSLSRTVGLDCKCRTNRSSRRTRGNRIQVTYIWEVQRYSRYGIVPHIQPSRHTLENTCATSINNGMLTPSLELLKIGAIVVLCRESMSCPECTGLPVIHTDEHFMPRLVVGSTWGAS